MNNFVFDTNSIISAHLLPSSITRRAYNIALKQGMLLYSRETLSELTEVFTREKFDKYISIEARLAAIAAYEKTGFLTDIETTIIVCRDSSDNKFLELAVSGNAKYIITGDEDLLVLNPFRNIIIISPANFVSEYSV